MKHLSLILCIFIFLSKPVYSQVSKNSIGVSPAVIDHILDPGSTKTVTVIFFNHGSASLPIKASISGNSDEDKYGLYQVDDWIKVEPESFIIKPQERKQIKLTFTPPVDISPGGHYATIYFQPLISTDKLQKNQVLITPKIGLLILLTIKGEVKEELSLISFKTKKIWLNDSGTFLIGLKNEGNIHSKTVGSINIHSSFFNKNYKIDFPATFFTPNRHQEKKFDSPFKFAIGKYTATADLVYGNSHHQILASQIEFYVLPLRIILVICSLTTLVIYLTINKRKLQKVFRILFTKNNDSI